MGFSWKQSSACLTKDPRAWSKVAIGGIVALIPIIGFVSVGFLVVLYRNILNDRPDDQVLPDWEDFGDFFFKGIPAAAIAFCYCLLFLVAFIVVLLMFFTAVLTGGAHPVSSILSGLVGLAALYGYGLLCGSALTYYGETLKVSSAFKVVDVFGRVMSMGKDYYMIMGVWAVSTFIVSFLCSFLPTILACLLACVADFIILVVTINSVGQVVETDFSPVVSDPVAPQLYAGTTLEEPKEPEEDVYGYAKPGKMKASAYASHKPDTSLTWSTDSDDAE